MVVLLLKRALRPDHLPRIWFGRRPASRLCRNCRHLTLSEFRNVWGMCTGDEKYLMHVKICLLYSSIAELQMNTSVEWSAW